MLAEFFSHQTGVHKERRNMTDHEHTIPVDPGTFKIAHSDNFLPNFKDIFCSVAYDSPDCFSIVFNDGRHRYFVVEQSALCQEDQETACRLIRIDQRQIHRDWVQDGKEWGAE